MSTEDTHYLYVLTNQTSGKKYVGVSKDPGARYLEHMTLDTNPGIMEDRSSAEFSMEILNKGSKKYIYQLEELTINKLNTRHPKGYNLALGGNGGDTGCAVKGSKHCKAKLSEDSVLEIRKRRAAGSSFKSLAEEYGVSSPTIRSACLGLTWKHVGGPMEVPKTREESSNRREEIKVLLSEGLSCGEIAKKLGLKNTLVYYYRSTL